MLRKKTKMQNHYCIHFPSQFCKSVIKTIFTHNIDDIYRQGLGKIQTATDETRGC